MAHMDNQYLSRLDSKKNPSLTSALTFGLSKCQDAKQFCNYIVCLDFPFKVKHWTLFQKENN